MTARLPVLVTGLHLEPVSDWLAGTQVYVSLGMELCFWVFPSHPSPKLGASDPDLGLATPMSLTQMYLAAPTPPPPTDSLAIYTVQAPCSPLYSPFSVRS